MKTFIIFGDGPLAERIYEYILQEGVHSILCFTNEKNFISRPFIKNLPVIEFENLENYYDLKNFEFLICIGYSQMNRLRENIYKLIKSKKFIIGTWISQKTIVYSNKINEGNIIMPGVVIGPNSIIGRCNIFESSSTLTHDNIIEDFNYFSTNVVLGGRAYVKSNCFLGLHSTIKNSISIADYSLIGAGSNVLKSTETYSVSVGNPAHQLINKNSLDTKI